MARILDFLYMLTVFGGIEMNASRRKDLNSAITFLSQASLIIDRALDMEEDCISNYPENLHGSDRFEKMEDSAEFLESASDKISDIIEDLRAAIYS